MMVYEEFGKNGCLRKSNKLTTKKNVEKYKKDLRIDKIQT